MFCQLEKLATLVAAIRHVNRRLWMFVTIADTRQSCRRLVRILHSQKKNSLGPFTSKLEKVLMH